MSTPTIPVKLSDRISEEGQHAYGSAHGPSKRRTMRDYVKEQYRKPKRTTVKCPICKGTGKLPHPKLGKRRDATAGIALSVMAKSLREQGFSLREIGGFLGYPSPRSVQMLLKKHGMK